LEDQQKMMSLSPREVRQAVREGRWAGPTAGMAPRFVQANLVILPRDWAFDFLLFCQRNPRPCPLLEVTEPGDWEPRGLAEGADLRSDLPRYRVYREGVLTEEPTDIRTLWREDLVSFLIGCSFTFEGALLEAGLPVRHIEMGVNVPMYVTSVACRTAGRLKGPMVMTMRPIPAAMVARAVTATALFPSVHGAPLHIGEPGAIGIKDLSRPDHGDPVEIREGEVPVFWGCGVTPQAVLAASRPPFAITHAPGHMFVSDKKNVDLSVF